MTMTSPEELAQTDATKPESSARAGEIPEKPESATDAQQNDGPQSSRATIEELAILDFAEYWGLDHGSLRNNEP